MAKKTKKKFVSVSQKINSASYYIVRTKMDHPFSEKAWTIWMVQVPTHANCQNMLTDDSVKLKYNISIIKFDWLAVICISSVRNCQLMLTRERT